MTRSRSAELFAAACKRLPGGVNSPVRAFKGVGGTPVFFEKAKGPHVWDVDGNRYIDYVGSWGPMILGHAQPAVIEAVIKAAHNGTSFGAPTAAETEFAELICSMMPNIEMLRAVNSGTEATLSAIRVARGYTGRPKLLKFKGCYHGHADSLLADAGSGVATLGIPGTPGVLPEVARNTITVPFNDEAALKAAFETHGAELAGAIIEPVAGNMGCIPPKGDFLALLRQLCTDAGTVLIFDEVMTGFRVAKGGVQALWNVAPDLTTLGKIVGGGMPVGVYGGKREIMEKVAPSGPIYQAGTLSGNPVAMAAGLATLHILNDTEGLYEGLDRATATLSKGMHDAAASAGLATVGHQVGAMFSLYFTDTQVWSYEAAKASKTELFARFFHEMLDRGVYLAPSAYEACFTGTLHSDAIIAETLVAARESFAAIAR
ncbi:MAG: glutamate-1-semialdehyde 2,1-aminomutase [Bradymonadia bacterium]|jgi:glutamate-1-semialdehyde 2,1-aminomutase